MPATLSPTPLCQLLGCRLPLLLAGMGGVSRHELVAAVTEAGGFGFLGMVREPLALIEREVAQLRARTDRPFGVNLIPAGTPAALLQSQVDLCIALGVPVVGLFWDVDRPLIARLRAAGITVVHQVGTLQDAIDAQDAGAQAQGECSAGAGAVVAMIATTRSPVRLGLGRGCDDGAQGQGGSEHQRIRRARGGPGHAAFSFGGVTGRRRTSV